MSGKMFLVLFAQTVFFSAVVSAQCLSPSILQSALAPAAINQPSTIISDYSPAVCKNLANTLQLLIVSNLLQNNLINKPPAPVLNEVALQQSILSSPLANILASSPNVISAPNILNSGLCSSPNIISSPNVISGNNLLSLLGSGLLGNLGCGSQSIIV